MKRQHQDLMVVMCCCAILLALNFALPELRDWLDCLVLTAAVLPVGYQ